MTAPLFSDPSPPPEPPPRPVYPPFAGLPDTLALRTLRARRQFVPWGLRLNKTGDRWVKKPLNVRSGHGASVADPETWCSYAEAIAYALDPENWCSGIGYVMTADDELGGGDLDDVVDDAGDMEPWAAELLAKAETYAELSPSGHGVRILGLGKPERAHVCKQAQTELYGAGRWLSLTGRHVPGTPTEIRPAPETFARLIARVTEFKDRLREEAARKREAEGRLIHEPKPRDPSKPPTYLDRVNAAAFANPEPWVAVLFGGYAVKAAAGGWRVASRHLCRDLDEDLSLHPSGFRDFGVHDLGDTREGRRSAIDLVVEWAELFGAMDGAPDLFGAAHWLCERLGVTPESMGWKAKKERKKAERRGTNDARPVITIRAGTIEENVDQMEAALIARGGIYQRGDRIVYIGDSPMKTHDEKEVSVARIFRSGLWSLREAVASAACILKYDARSDDDVVSDPSKDLIATLMERKGRLRLPTLAAIVSAPTLRPDGTVLETPGYDARTGMFFDPRGVDFPPIPSAPTRPEALEALAALGELIDDFPFVGGPDRSVALSAVLTACTRQAYPFAPMHGFTAPAAGTGKGKLVDVASVLAFGRPAGVVSPSSDERELEKRLGAELLDGVEAIALDNCTAPVGGDFLCSVLTQAVVNIRPLGGSDRVPTPTNALLTCTGNNLVILGDLTRRTVVCHLDAKVERPELRVFGFEPVERARAGRARYVAAALTIVRAYRAAGSPPQGDPLGSFEAWSRTVRDALLWLGCADPLLTMDKIRKADPAKVELSEVLAEWEDKIGSERITATEISDKVLANNWQHFRKALLIVAEKAGRVDAVRLGIWLGKKANVIADGRYIEEDGKFRGTKFWKLRRVEGEGVGGDEGVPDSDAGKCQVSIAAQAPDTSIGTAHEPPSSPQPPHEEMATSGPRGVVFEWKDWRADPHRNTRNVMTVFSFSVLGRCVKANVGAVVSIEDGPYAQHKRYVSVQQISGRSVLRLGAGWPDCWFVVVKGDHGGAGYPRLPEAFDLWFPTWVAREGVEVVADWRAEALAAGGGNNWIWREVHEAAATFSLPKLPMLDAPTRTWDGR